MADTPPPAANGFSTVPIPDAEFAIVQKLVYDTTGINLTEEKRSLVSTRLQKLLREKGLASYTTYTNYLTADKTGQAIIELADCISTNHTYFYRERPHFDFLTNQLLPELIRQKKAQNCRDIRIWCAAAATGEEPYTLAIILKEFLAKEPGTWEAGLLATDISGEALATAVKGVYPPERVEGTPPLILKKYFSPRPDGHWVVANALKADITFRRFNLMNEQFPFKKPFDVIFCRNVMIYFDQKTRDALARRFYQFTTLGGYLFIGHSESLGRENSPYTYIKPAVYQRKD